LEKYIVCCWCVLCIIVYGNSYFLCFFSEGYVALFDATFFVFIEHIAINIGYVMHFFSDITDMGFISCVGKSLLDYTDDKLF